MTSLLRRRWTAEEKLRILEEARQTGVSVSEVCRHHQIAPGQFYLWERQARQGALQALRDGKRGRKPTDPTVRLQAELDRLRVIVAELSTENLQLNKGLWP
jgi:transposase-like protein